MLEEPDVYAPPEAHVADVDPAGAYRPELILRRRRQLLVMTAAPFLVMGGGVLAVVVSGLLLGSGSSLPGVVGIAVFVAIPAGLHLFSRWNWRCPDCGGYLGANTYAKRCRKCGSRLTVPGSGAAAPLRAPAKSVRRRAPR